MERQDFSKLQNRKMKALKKRKLDQEDQSDSEKKLRKRPNSSEEEEVSD